MASFARDTQGFKLQEYSTGAFLDSGIHFDATEKELVYQDFNRRPPEVRHDNILSRIRHLCSFIHILNFLFFF